MKTLKTLEAEMLADPVTRAEYEALEHEFVVARELIAARAGLAPVVTAECCDGAWTVFWDEPAGGANWEAYTQAAEAVLIPAMQAQWPAWKLAKATSRSVVLMKSPHGLIRGITEGCARDVVAVVLGVFPGAVVTWLPEVDETA